MNLAREGKLEITEEMLLYPRKRCLLVNIGPEII
jgi:hypothetical protein